MSKVEFAAKSLVKYATFQSRSCPHCGNPSTRVLGRKHVLVELRRCESCGLQFRFPKDNQQENSEYYQEDYRQENVTDLPAEADIARHIETRFAEVGRDLTVHLSNIAKYIPVGSRILDYGSSWGYCVYQFNQAGYQAAGFEISRSRVDYGKKVLGVDLTSNLASLSDGSFDAIYSAHVLEHIPNPASSFLEFQRLIRPGGYLFIYVPNGGGKDARDLGVKWPPMINEKHVIAFTPEFFHRNLPKYGFSVLFSSSPYDLPAATYEENPPIDGEELLVIARKL